MSEARAIIEQLIEEGIAAKAHFQTWWALRNLALPEYHPTMNDLSYVDFFQTSNSGHYKLIFISLSKIFDRDERVSGISRLKEALQNEGYAQLARDVETKISPLDGLVRRVLNIRNKTIAHNEHQLPRQKVYELNGVTPNEIRQLIDSTCDAINSVARGFGLTNTIFDSDRHERATLAMLKTLRRGNP